MENPVGYRGMSRDPTASHGIPGGISHDANGMPRYPMGSLLGCRGISRGPVGIHAQITPGSSVGIHQVPLGCLGVRVRARVCAFAGTRGIPRGVAGTRGGKRRQLAGLHAGTHGNAREPAHPRRQETADTQTTMWHTWDKKASRGIS